MLNIIFVVGILGWMGFARTVRSSVLSIKERPFIEAARAAGAGGSHIMVKHIIPNVMPLVYVTLAMSVPGAIVSEAALSWLGLGPTDVMSWGRMLHEFQSSGVLASAALSRWYWVIPPGVCIAALSLSFVLIGYGLDEILNPKLRARH
jgi:peptide/nickel transport system permease protein